MGSNDHPLDALQPQYDTEDTFVTPIAKVVISIASSLPMPWPLDRVIAKVKDYLGADSTERIKLMLETCASEVRMHDDRLRNLEGDRRAMQDYADTSRDLLLDAARKAESTRAKERIKRIALILANALVAASPPDTEETEELMRIAMNLSDSEIGYLRELIRIEGHMLMSRDHIDRYQAHEAWAHGFWGASVDPNLDSVFSKLESYGLFARIAPPNNLNITADFQNRYVLLNKGLRLAEMIREAATLT